MNVVSGFRFTLFFCIGTAIVSTGSGETLFQHSGSNDPVADEAWGLDSPGFGVTVGLINDAGTSAWFVDDNSTGGGSTLIGRFENWFFPYNLLTENRRFRDVLHAKAYDVEYADFSGGHEPICWRGPFVDGLIALTTAKKWAK